MRRCKLERAMDGNNLMDAASKPTLMRQAIGSKINQAIVESVLAQIPIRFVITKQQREDQ
jgi:hypothetical protein